MLINSLATYNSTEAKQRQVIWRTYKESCPPAPGPARAAGLGLRSYTKSTIFRAASPRFSCSQTRMTVQPAATSLRSVSASRLRVVSIARAIAEASAGRGRRSVYRPQASLTKNLTVEVNAREPSSMGGLNEAPRAGEPTPAAELSTA